jgi:hypothetical protein
MIFLIDNHNTSDPHVNLALEAYALRYLDPDRSYFLMYVNQPAVIVGIGFEKIGHAAKLEKRLMGIPYHLEAIRTRLSGVDVRVSARCSRRTNWWSIFATKGSPGSTPVYKVPDVSYLRN